MSASNLQSGAGTSSIHGNRYMTARVFWMHTDGGEPGDGAWYWCETDENDEHVGDMVGPFETAIEAGKHCRKAIINRTQGSARSHDHKYEPGAYGVCRRCGDEKHP